MHAVVISNGHLQASQSADLVVPWWSFTKTVLATASLCLVSDRGVDLDEKLSGQQFTLRQLLRHEAGLADYGELAEYHTAVANGESAWPVDEMLHRLDGDRLRYPPGSGWCYSNVGYLHVANLITELTGLALSDALNRLIFSPLGLSRTHVATTRADLKNTCLGPGRYDPGWVYHGLVVGPLAEAAIFLDSLFAGHVLPDELLQEMQAALKLGWTLPGRPWIEPGYGLGLMQGVANGGLTLSGHTGAGPGSVIAIYRCGYGSKTATCATFDEGDDQGTVEDNALGLLSGCMAAADINRKT